MTYIIDDSEWVRGSLNPKDWHLIENTIHKYGVKSVLEFGSGVSTYAFKLLGMDRVTLEDDRKWQRIVKEKYGCYVVHWDILYKHMGRSFDLSFIDGPHDVEKREVPFQMAIDHQSEFVACHDVHTPSIQRFEKKYLAGYDKIGNVYNLNVWKRNEV